MSEKKELSVPSLNAVSAAAEHPRPRHIVLFAAFPTEMNAAKDAICLLTNSRSKSEFSKRRGDAVKVTFIAAWDNYDEKQTKKWKDCDVTIKVSKYGMVKNKSLSLANFVDVESVGLAIYDGIHRGSLSVPAEDKKPKNMAEALWCGSPLELGQYIALSYINYRPRALPGQDYAGVFVASHFGWPQLLQWDIFSGWFVHWDETPAAALPLDYETPTHGSREVKILSGLPLRVTLVGGTLQEGPHKGRSEDVQEIYKVLGGRRLVLVSLSTQMEFAWTAESLSMITMAPFPKKSYHVLFVLPPIIEGWDPPQETCKDNLKLREAFSNFQGSHLRENIEIRCAPPKFGIQQAEILRAFGPKEMALVTHGGESSIREAIQTGHSGLIFLPLGIDQGPNAIQLARSGVGINLGSLVQKKYSGGTLAAYTDSTNINKCCCKNQPLYYSIDGPMPEGVKDLVTACDYRWKYLADFNEASRKLRNELKTSTSNNEALAQEMLAILTNPAQIQSAPKLTYWDILPAQLKTSAIVIVFVVLVAIGFFVWSCFKACCKRWKKGPKKKTPTKDTGQKNENKEVEDTESEPHEPLLKAMDVEP